MPGALGHGSGAGQSAASVDVAMATVKQAVAAMVRMLVSLKAGPSGLQCESV